MATHELPPLPYAYDALEPWIDEPTMKLHHDKHHQAYLDNFVKAITGTPFEKLNVKETLGKLDQVPDTIRGAVRNHGGGYANHTLFWEIMGPKAGGQPGAALADALTSTFGSFDAFKEKFTAAAMGQFGSGWAWLVVGKDRKLGLYSLPNQDSPLSSGDTPILGLDVWEHAYYLKYQNRRAEYVGNWWNVVSWPKVAERFAKAQK
ncbi:MAG: superoxide dismutase [Acidobacteriota bacterium]